MAVGQQGYAMGAIADQTLLLQDIRSGLAVYNQQVDPWIARLAEPTIRQTLRVSQAPKQFRLKGDGGSSNSERTAYRTLNVPFNTYDLNSEFTVEWLQDALPSDIMNEMTTAIAGDVELINGLFFSSIFTKQTVGAIGTAYQAGFYNGEVDVPNYKNTTHFGTAHYHYLGLNTTTLTRAHLQSARIDVQEHGFGLTPGSLFLFINSAQSDDVANLMNTNSADTIVQAITDSRQIAIDRSVVNTGASIDGMMIVVTDDVPAGYFAVIAADARPIAMRQHFNSTYQGLQDYTDSSNAQYPLMGLKFMRRIGFAVQQLGAGTCRQLVASTTYTNPTMRLPASV
jgi:hypothetical protein